MNFWNRSDLEVMELRDKIISLKQEFDSTHKQVTNDYSQKFNRFLESKLKSESDLIFRKQVLVTAFSMEIHSPNKSETLLWDKCLNKQVQTGSDTAQTKQRGKK